MTEPMSLVLLIAAVTVGGTPIVSASLSQPYPAVEVLDYRFHDNSVDDRITVGLML